MTTWGAGFYGDPCLDCGYSWSMSREEANALIADAPRRYAELLDGADGSTRHPALTWSVTAYVEHVADNLRNWAERIMNAVAAGQTTLRPTDQDVVAVARAYESMPLATALWSVGHSASIWADAMAASAGQDIMFSHPTRGQQSLTELVLTVAHDTAHH